MELIMPGLGLVFWTTLAFAAVLYILKRYAWKPIFETIKAREVKISESLHNAEKIKKEYEDLEEFKEKEFNNLEIEKQDILNSTKHQAEEIINKAKQKAIEESERIIAEAQKAVNIERRNAIADIKKQLAILSLDMAEKVLEEEFADKAKQSGYINKLLENISLN